ncbi:MAG: hypothetical protein CHACPFDD_02860 [Phycisphaerae bacterium]|nr:hypothetical protein [Phycisphaerae bacterium]
MSFDHLRRRAALGAIVAVLGTVAWAAESRRFVSPDAPDTLNLRAGDISTADLPNLLAADAPFAADEHYLIQLDGPITRARREVLTALGVVLYDHLPQNAYIAQLAGVSPAALRGTGFVGWVGYFDATWKLDPEIGQRVYQTPGRQAIADAGEVLLLVQLFAGADMDAALTDVAAIAGVEIAFHENAGGDQLVHVRAPQGTEGSLALLSRVQWVEEFPELTLRNNSNRWIVQSNQNNVTPLYNNGIHGEGQILGHIDGQLAVNHCSFVDTDPIGSNHRKIQAYNTTQGYDQHGTHTAGTAVGDSGANDNARGVAYLGRLCHNSIPGFGETAMFNRLNTHRGQGATVHTNSWGNDGTTVYDGMCRGIDNFSWQFDDQLVCFAVTNLSTLKNPENAKNCMAVGASQDSPSQGNHCSGGQGPTADGRRKPEIYAPGCGTNSSSGSSGCSTASLTGTSMASPAIAGTGLLVRQYFAAGYYPSGAAVGGDGFTPSGALIKAALINSSVDMTGVTGYPSNREGWGRVLADNALFFTGDARKLIVRDVRNNTGDALTTGESVTVNFTVQGGSQQLRVTLAFHDAPGAANASNPVINNIDLVVDSPSATYRGNVFNTSTGVSITGGTADTKNNVEQVHLSNPETGVWSATISAASVSTGSQGYALVITGDVLDVTCNELQITEQPSDQQACEGGTATFTTAATGTDPVTFQWRKDFADLPGETNPTLVISPVSLSDAGSYDCVITDLCTVDVTFSADLTVGAGNPCDANCDGSVNGFDVEPFVGLLAGTGTPCAECVGDTNGDGSVNGFDVDDFVACLTGP